jgi:hypothetical protein
MILLSGVGGLWILEKYRLKIKSPRLPAPRQPARGFHDRRTLRRADKGRCELQGAGDGKRSLPDAWRQEHRPAHS